MMKSWEFPSNVKIDLLKCVLCNTHSEWHQHLFFECSYASQVWSKVKGYTNILVADIKWDAIVNQLIPMSKSNIGRLALGATSYFIWQERNLRIHKKGARSVEQVFNVIFDTIRLKIHSLHFKKMSCSNWLLEKWKIS